LRHLLKSKKPDVTRISAKSGFVNMTNMPSFVIELAPKIEKNSPEKTTKTLLF